MSSLHSSHQPRYLLDISLLSACYYAPEGHSYGLGRVLHGYAEQMHQHFKEDLGICSYYNNAETNLYLRRKLPDLLSFSVERDPCALERLAIRLVDACQDKSGKGGWSTSFFSKAFRWLWRRYNDGWKMPLRAYGKQALQQAKLIQCEYYHDIVDQVPGEKLVCMIYDLFAIHDGDFELEKRLRDIVHKGAHFVCISEYTARDLERLIPEAKGRVFWSHLGLDTCFYPNQDASMSAQWLQQLNLKGRPYFVAQTGVLERKNTETIVKAVARLRQETGVDFQLVFVGYMKTIIQTLDAKLGDMPWREFVIFAGALKDEEFKYIYDQAIAFLFFSRAEGFGFGPLEAMACGIPAVTSNCMSVPEVVGDAGPCFDPDDLDGFCGEMLRLYQDENYRKERIAKSLQQASQFTWKAAGDRLANIWKIITTH